MVKKGSKKTHSSEAKVGSKLQVFRGTAEHTSGGLTRSDLMQNKHGKVVSKKQHAHGMKMAKHIGVRGGVMAF